MNETEPKSFLTFIREGITNTLPVDPTKRWEASVLLEVHNSNPNGDPDRDGGPRLYRDTYGLMSGQSFKRPIRDYFADVLGLETYIARGVNLSKDRKDIMKERKGEGVMSVLANQKYIDVRLFGAVLSDDRVRGSMQIPDGITLAPINLNRQSLTRVASDGKGEGKATMGSKEFVEYGQYRFDISYSPGVGKVNGVTRDDLVMFWEALLMAFERNKSSTRGHVRITDIVSFEHTNALGDMSEYKVRKGFICKKNESSITVDDSISLSDISMGGIRRQFKLTINREVYEDAASAKLGQWDLDGGFGVI